MLDILSLSQFRAAYTEERERVLAMMENRPSGGGNFYDTQAMRVSKALCPSAHREHT